MPEGQRESGSATQRPGWQAELTLAFDRTPERTRLCRREHLGPLQVQRPFYPEADGGCHVYLLHPPGGVVGGDRLSLEAHVGEHASALLTTPAATKFYRSAGARAEQTQRLYAGNGAALEWLPQETIVFRGAQLHTLTRVELHQSAAFIGWEVLCLGRPAAGERFDTGLCRQSIEVWRDAQPLLIERGRFGSDQSHSASGIADASWGLRGQPVTATLIAVAPATPPTGAGTVSSVDFDVLREALNAAASDDDQVSVSALEQVIVCRYLGPSAERARSLFGQAWALLRPALLGKTACPPRVWNC